MDASLKEILDLVARWIHVIAGIMWVGNSMLFNWLDRNLVKKAGAPENHLGEIWLLHSGAFYQVEKKFLAPSEIPELLHWFKWQSYTTWITGFCLLVLVYYLGGGALLVDPNVSSISVEAATAIGLGTLVGAWLVYEVVGRSPLMQRPFVLAILGLAAVGGVAYGLAQVLSGRAMFMHVGAMLGSLMAGNVFFYIIPSQKELVSATKSGDRPNVAMALRAKNRSIHNNYFTFPVLFVMVSNHFPSFYGHHMNWLLLVVLVLGGALSRHFMNIRFHFGGWRYALASTIAVTVGLLVFVGQQPRPAVAGAGGSAAGPEARWTGPVSYHEVRGVLDRRCVTCHAREPSDTTFGKNPSGVVFEDAAAVKRLVDRIKVRAVDTRTMPPANKTGITPEERDLLGQWIGKGAPVH